MKRFIVAATVALLALALAACGGSGNPKTVRVCSGLTDKCQTVPLRQLQQLKQRQLRLTATRGCIVVDVSDYQGYINWNTARPYICGGISKGGEGGSYAGGNYFYHNWTSLRALGVWHSIYWFMRGGVSCATQANLIISRLNSVGYAHDPTAGDPQLDIETPGANDYGMTQCVTDRIWSAFHRHTGVYTSPGTWPGGSHGNAALWQATYGSGFTPFWTPVVAWQCTDGVNGCVHYVGGIGYDDVSINYGITNEHGGPPPPPPPPPDPFHYKIFSKDVHKVAKLGTFSELSAVLHYDGARKHPVKYASYLKHTLEPELLVLANQIVQRVNGETRHCVDVASCAPNWNKFNRGERQLLLRARAQGKQVAR